MTNPPGRVAKLADAGIRLHQSVLLAGIMTAEDHEGTCPPAVKTYPPYYLYQCDLSEGISHFRTRYPKASKSWRTSSAHQWVCCPTVRDRCTGWRREDPDIPNYLLTWSCISVLRNYEG